MAQVDMKETAESDHEDLQERSGDSHQFLTFQLAGEVYGIDITQAGVDLCRKRFEFLGLDGDFRVADAQNLPFESKL